MHVRRNAPVHRPRPPNSAPARHFAKYAVDGAFAPAGRSLAIAAANRHSARPVQRRHLARPRLEPAPQLRPGVATASAFTSSVHVRIGARNRAKPPLRRPPAGFAHRPVDDRKHVEQVGHARPRQRLRHRPLKPTIAPSLRPSACLCPPGDKAAIGAAVWEAGMDVGHRVRILEASARLLLRQYGLVTPARPAHAPPGRLRCATPSVMRACAGAASGRPPK